MYVLIYTYLHLRVHIYTDKHLTYQGRGVLGSGEEYVVVSHSVAYVDDLLHAVSRFLSQVNRSGYTHV
jgi:hypothetical protein